MAIIWRIMYYRPDYLEKPIFTTGKIDYTCNKGSILNIGKKIAKFRYLKFLRKILLYISTESDKDQVFTRIMIYF